MKWLSTRYDEFFMQHRLRSLKNGRVSRMLPVLDTKDPKYSWDNCLCTCGHVAAMHTRNLSSMRGYKPAGLCLMAGCNCRELNTEPKTNV